MSLNKSNEIISDEAIKSKKLKKEHKKLFKEKISTDEGYNDVVCSLDFVESMIGDEQRIYLETYRTKLLNLCSEKKQILTHPDVKNVIGECNDKFIDVFGEKRTITNNRLYRGVLSDISA